MKQLWLRVGISLEMTDEEADVILSGTHNADEIAETVTNIILDKRFNVCGESYVPYSSVEQYNEQHKTNYSEDDIEMADLNIAKEEMK